ncbi:MAG: winged helix-turn-helix domain-containing protein [Candidatus Loosdrechtia sp.]|uniref:winged helix-turn-helix domain-containing protein n=1 Tax=Candidatus Loosdrechtia sp. TaxID=3101272 RepID=UPI003A6FEE4D|nr:MAG: LysR family transcriptional regulator [Candidatus Jettenia sp. AMX2]
MKVKFKVWLEENDGVAFAEGRKMLLEAVDRLGSLNAAAKELGMSYRAAWGKVKATEKALGVKLLEVTTGGKGGGGAILTKEAKKLISDYKKYTSRIAVLLEKEFKRVFKEKNG